MARTGIMASVYYLAIKRQPTKLRPGGISKLGAAAVLAVTSIQAISKKAKTSASNRLSYHLGGLKHLSYSGVRGVLLMK